MSGSKLNTGLSSGAGPIRDNKLVHNFKSVIEPPITTSIRTNREHAAAVSISLKPQNIIILQCGQTTLRMEFTGRSWLFPPVICRVFKLESKSGSLPLKYYSMSDAEKSTSTEKIFHVLKVLF